MTLRARAPALRPLLTRVMAILLVVCLAPRARSETGQPSAPADVDRLLRELSSWGRWGDDDQLGALNLITAAKRKEAAALVTEGISVSLARDVEKRRAPDNSSPFEHTMLATGDSSHHWGSDQFSVAYHGYAHTHLDALCHVFHDGKMYNGFSSEAVKKAGATRLGIEHYKSGILTRGVLMDIPRLRGVDYLDPGTPIYARDLQAWEEKIGTKVSRGDVVIIRTGRWARREAVGPWDIGKEGAAGLHVSATRWLRERDISILGSDAAADVLPSRVDGYSHPVHLVCIYAMGVPILDNCDLEALSDKAHALGRWEFLLTMAPLAVPGGTGSPLNPVATF